MATNSFLFSSRDGIIRIGTVNTINAGDNIASPGTINLIDIKYNSSTVTPSGSLSSGNGIIYGVNQAGTYKVYAFGGTNTPTVPPGGTYSSDTYSINYYLGSPSTVFILAVGGGGGGGYNNDSGGGGAGGVVMTQVNLPSGPGTINISVGAGGYGRNTTNGTSLINCCGNNTTVKFTTNPESNIIAGGGGPGNTNGETITYTLYGSGGGANGSATNTAGNNDATLANPLQPNGLIVYSNNGYNPHQTTTYTGSAGGGGGAKTIGGISVYNSGGDGIQCTLNGITDFNPSGYSNFGSFYFGGGGGASNPTTGGPGGKGGGGGGTTNTGGTSGGTGGISGGTGIANGGTGLTNNTSGGNGAPFTGGGGGGTYSSTSGGGNGGSGIVAIAFPISTNVFSLSYPLNFDSSLIAYYTFETSSGTTLYNNVTSTYDATLSSTSIINQTYYKKGSNSAYFDGVSNNYIKLSNSLVIGTSGCTIVYWMYRISFPAGQCITWAMGDLNATNSNGCIAHYDNNGNSQVYSARYSSNMAFNSNTVPLNTWTHYALAIQNTSNTSYTTSYYLFINGKPYSNYVNYGTNYCFTTTALNNVFIGSGYDSSKTPSQRPSSLNAYIDDFRIYNRALSAGEIASLYSYY